MTSPRTIVASLALALLCAATGCPKKAAPAPPAPPPSNTALGGTLGRAPEGGSQTVFGKARDRAVDAQIMSDMRQAKLALDADFPNGKGPADTKAWLVLLRDFRILRPMVEKGEVVAYPGVDVLRQQPGTVLMYETRAEQGDGIVLFCDGDARRVQSKEEFAALPRPKP